MSTASTSKILQCSVNSITFSDDGTPHFSDTATRQHIERAAVALRNNELVAFPTETVYGLGGSALPFASTSNSEIQNSSSQLEAIPKIYAAKGRPSDNPLIVHVSSREQLDALIDPTRRSSLPQCYKPLMDRFWPGPLTLLLPTIPGELVSKHVTAGLDTVGVRMPAHPVARALIALSGIPIAAPSANTSGKPSPTTAQHVAHDLHGRNQLVYILDGGSCNVGLESTVVSALAQHSANRKGKQPADSSISHSGETSECLYVLRLGGASPEELQQCLRDAGLSTRVSLGGLAPQPQCNGNSINSMDNHLHLAGQDFIPSTPGMKYKHYSPNARVVILSARSSSSRQASESVLKVLQPYSGKRVGLLHLSGSSLSDRLLEVLPDAPRVLLGDAKDHVSQAQRLFGGLRTLDEQAVDVIFVEAVSETGLGRTVMERLRKAAGGADPIFVCP